MSLTNIIQWRIIFSVCLILYITMCFLKKPYQKYIRMVLIIFMLASIGLSYLIRPLLVDWQTDQAIERLEDHLTKLYIQERWTISDTNDKDLRDVKYLHVVFGNEPELIYYYMVERDNVWQITFHGREAEEPKSNLFERRIIPKHLE